MYTEMSRWSTANWDESGETSNVEMCCGWRGLDVSGSEYYCTG